MTRMSLLAVFALVLGPAVALAGPKPTAPKVTSTAKPKLSPKVKANIKLTQPAMKKLVGPSLSKVQLGAKIKEAGLAKPADGDVQVQDVKVVSPTQLRVDGAYMTLLCPTYVTGFAEHFPASFMRDEIKDCPVAGAEVNFPVQAGRVYVVECQTNNIPWRMTRIDGQTDTSDVRTTGSTLNPTFVMLAERTGWAGVRFDLSRAHDYYREYQIGRCQVGQVAG